MILKKSNFQKKNYTCKYKKVSNVEKIYCFGDSMRQLHLSHQPVFSGLVDWIWKRKLIQTRLSQRPVYLGLAVGECPCTVFVPFLSMLESFEQVRPSLVTF